MKKIIISTFVLLFMIGIASANSPEIEWGKTYDWAFGLSAAGMVKTNDGGYAITGYEQFSENRASRNPILLKIDGFGNKVFQKSYRNSLRQRANNLIQDEQGNFALAGITKYGATTQEDFLLIKTDSSGNLIYSKTYENPNYHEVAMGITKTRDGNYVLAGSYVRDYDNTPPSYQFKVLEADSNDGSEISTKIWGSENADNILEIVSLPDEGYIVTGHYNGRTIWPGYTGDSDLYIARLDNSFNVVWERTYGGGENDKGNHIIPVSSGGYIAVGYTESYGNGEEDVYIVKVDESGNLLWEKTFGGISTDNAVGVIENNNGEFVISGYTNSFGEGQRDILVIKLNQNGGLVWYKTIGTDQNEVVYNGGGQTILQAEDGGYLIAGMQGPGNSYGNKIYLVKLGTDCVDTDKDGICDENDICLLDPENDADSDGICGNVDMCEDTKISEQTVPQIKLGVNRFALIDDDLIFDTTTPKGKGPKVEFSLEDTKGCSCEQILTYHLGNAEEMKGHWKFGCSKSVIEDWINSL